MLLIESHAHPRPKACAEYASPRIVEELARLGVREGDWRADALPLKGMRVIRGDDAMHHLLGEAFGFAARAAAERAPRADEHADAPEDVARVLRAFVHDGRLTSIPAVHSKRLVILDWLAQRFEPGRRYTEETVNLVIAQVHPDTAALRRYLVDDGLMDREQGVYWRAGGTVSE